MKNESTNVKGWQRVLLLIIPYLIIVSLFQFIGYLVAGIDITSPEYDRTSFQRVIVKVFDFIGNFLVLWMFMRFFDRESFISLGFHVKNRLSGFISGIIVGLIVMMFGFIVLILCKEIFILAIHFDLIEFLTLIVLFTFVAVVEETLLRGYILRNFLNSFSKYMALVLSSVLFSIMHGGNPSVNPIAFLNLFLLGIVFGLPYVYTKNLWFSISLHFSWNFFQSLFGFKVSGLESYSLIEFKILDDNFLNGGKFGFEGSYLSLLAEVILIIVIFVFYKNHVTANEKNPI